MCPGGFYEAVLCCSDVLLAWGCYPGDLGPEKGKAPAGEAGALSEFVGDGAGRH